MISWCASTEQVELVQGWAKLPDDLWMSLCIPHQMAIFELYHVDMVRLDRATKYWDARFERETA